MPAAIELRGVVKAFDGIRALDGLTADIEAGRLTGLVGPDGAGKTTLLRIMAALMAPDAGSVTVAGHAAATAAARIHSIVGYMPQRFGLYEDLAVGENLGLYAALRGVDTEAAEGTFAELLRFTGLAPFTGRLAGHLSGGMKQKLGLACALLGRPEILLLDEPSVGVDPVSRRELWALVRELAAEGLAVVWSTAYLDEAEQCDSVLLLNEGRLAHAGEPRGLTRQIAGRSLRIAGVESGRRRLLAEAVDLPSVGDGVIQGANVRLVMSAEADTREVQALAARHGGRLEPVEPRFEDAFIDLLGGGPGRSTLAAGMRPVELDVASAVECRHLTRRFGDFLATDDVTFEVRKGEVFGLLGPNGAGKSTTFRMLCGLLEPSSGEARVAGHDLRRAPGDAKLRLGYMAQKFSLYGLLSVRQNLEFFSGVYGLSGREQRERIAEMIEVFDLGRYLAVSPDKLPLGYKQRLALACALMHRPPVLFLDEPTSGVDPITRREFWSHINGLVQKGVTVLVTTHFMDEAEYCDRVALMYRARVIALDSPDALKASVASEELPEPTMEDAFVRLVELADRAHAERSAA
ncbi:MAG TPA: ATP-binding cassette domain-containing protein [Woeseiaceae bacterium]|nr:ATP-binding cassette domain-containing protein [Woeseiaceae bacterium]